VLFSQTDGTSLAETMTGGTIGVMTGPDMTKIVARRGETMDGPPVTTGTRRGIHASEKPL
jgi:hypothetical protein